MALPFPGDRVSFTYESKRHVQGPEIARRLANGRKHCQEPLALERGGKGPGPGGRSGARWVPSLTTLRTFAAWAPLGPEVTSNSTLFVLREAPVAVALNRAEVHEHVRATFMGDEAVALRGVEPLHDALEPSTATSFFEALAPR